MWNKFLHDKETVAEQYETHNWSAGLSVDELKKEVLKIFDDIGENNYPRFKANAVAFILRNASIDICPQDFFADKINHGDIMCTYKDKMSLYVRNTFCKNSQARTVNAVKIGAYNADTDFGHIAPDWNFLMKHGIVGVIERLEFNREKYKCEIDKKEYYDNCLTVYHAIIDLLKRMAHEAEKKNTEKSNFVAQNLYALASDAPKTLAQAMQLSLLFYKIQTHLECTIIRTLGGLDRLYCPFYVSDIESGNFTEEQLRELTAGFLWKIHALHVTANMAFYIGGKTDGFDAVNVFTRVILEEYRKLDICDPKMHVLYHSGMDKDIIDLILEMIREGKNSFVFINTEVASKALENIGILKEDAERLTVYGCYEVAAEGTEVPATCAGQINMAKAIELAFNNGIDMKTGIRFGPETGEDFDTFESFLFAVKTQLEFMTVACMEDISNFEKYCSSICPSPILSATYESSVTSGTDMYMGGAKYSNTSVVGAGIATLVDSIAAVKQIVYDYKKLSFVQLRDVLLSNWESAPELRSFCLNLPEKYGNNDFVDSIAVDVFETFANIINGRKNGRGGVFRCGMFSVDWRYWMGAATSATPDGRLGGEPISKNTAAVIGQDKKGVTALLNTMLKIDAKKTPDGYVADVVLHESAVSGEDGLFAFRILLSSFMRNGGFSIHFNVLCPEILRKAQQEPENYKNLQIRLCGWNVYFVNLSRKEQDEFIFMSGRG